jgi:hypothetical protein
MMVDSSSNTTSGSDRTIRAKAAELNHVQRVRQQLNTATDSSSSKETTMAMMW